MTIKTYQSPDWEVITTERRKALEAVADAAEIMVNDPRRATSMKSAHILREKLAALKETDEKVQK